MAKKKTTKKKKSELTDSLHQVWLAGLGALATAEEEGGKLFKSLVKKGQAYEKNVKVPVDKAAKSVKGTVKDVRSKAGKTMKKFEAALDDHVDAALGRIGVPTNKEIAKLTRKVDRLTKKLEESLGTKPKKKAKKKVSKKTK
jgi:poly(hydroxyalkanoate) granule-associated protein